MTKKLSKQEKYAKTPKGKDVLLKSVAKYNKKVNANKGTLRINKDLLIELRKIEGKNDDERLKFLLDK